MSPSLHSILYNVQYYRTHPAYLWVNNRLFNLDFNIDGCKNQGEGRNLEGEDMTIDLYRCVSGHKLHPPSRPFSSTLWT
jgi:hypothetical protein